jgi:2-dehydropantoate 2-reductase
MAIARGMQESFTLIQRLGYRIYPSMKALLHAAPAWLVAVLLWSLSRIRSFRELLATGVNECRALVDVLAADASEVLGPIGTCVWSKVGEEPGLLMCSTTYQRHSC